jgi:hypothetical protein
MDNNTIVNSQIQGKHFYRLVGGILLLAIAFLWLEQFKGTMFLISKIEFVLAAVLFTRMPRYFKRGRSFRLAKEWRSAKDWAIGLAAGMLMSTGLIVFGKFEPYSISNTLKFVAGASAIMYGIELILGKADRRQSSD